MGEREEEEDDEVEEYGGMEFERVSVWRANDASEDEEEKEEEFGVCTCQTSRIAKSRMPLVISQDELPVVELTKAERRAKKEALRLAKKRAKRGPLKRPRTLGLAPSGVKAVRVCTVCGALCGKGEFREIRKGSRGAEYLGWPKGGYLCEEDQEQWDSNEHFQRRCAAGVELYTRPGKEKK